MLAHENQCLLAGCAETVGEVDNILILLSRRESQGSRSSQPGPPQRKSSTDGNERYFTAIAFSSTSAPMILEVRC